MGCSAKAKTGGRETTIGLWIGDHQGTQKKLPSFYLPPNQHHPKECKSLVLPSVYHLPFKIFTLDTLF